MKTISFLIFLFLPAVVFSQVITEEELSLMVKDAQEKCAGAHQSILLQANEDFAKTIWGKKVRFNEASIVRFFTHSAGEKVSAGVDILKSTSSGWVYEYDQQKAADLLTKNGVNVTQSYNTRWIKARQNLLYAEVKKDGAKIILELYCPYQRFLEVLRTGKTQSIEFLITGYKGSLSSSTKVYGILTEVYANKQVVKCSNGHEFDKAMGYKFCPTCGEPLEEPQEL
ncbi:MAG: hypothetical protein U9R60_13870 [Bacteroidota bacterium]|nr:hypothetical protein [Bacteroidota bacterium]